MSEKSTHKCPVFNLTALEHHPMADRLKLVRIPDTSYVYCANYEDWKDHIGKKVCWIPPDSLVDTNRPEFSFLKEDAKYDADGFLGGSYARVKAKKLRQVISFGVLVLAPENLNEGDNGAEALGVTHYEPALSYANSPGGRFITSGEVASPPAIPFHVETYDIDSVHGYTDAFVEGEPVFATLKYHGCQARYTWWEGRYHCGSKAEWKKEFPTKPVPNAAKLIEAHGEELGKAKIAELEDKFANWNPMKNLWWMALEQNEAIAKFCRDNPGVVVYGEILNIQGELFTYGCKPNEFKIKVFDILANGKYLNPVPARQFGESLDWVKTVADNVPFNLEKMVELAESLGKIENDLEEGIVISPMEERYHIKAGRVKLKIVRSEYYDLTKKKNKKK